MRYSFLALIFLSTLAKAGEPVSEAMRVRIKASREAWSSWKVRKQGNYTYYTGGGDWTGTQYLSITAVKNDQPIFLKTCEIRYGAVDQKTEKEKAVSLDQLYDLCESEILPGAKSHGKDVFLRFSKENILLKCEYYEPECEDCGPRGFQLLGIHPGLENEFPCANTRITGFRPGSSNLSTQAQTELQNLARMIKSAEGWKFQIEGHTDMKGTVEQNLILGEKRANAAKTFLASQGVRSDQMTVIAYGKEKPLKVPDSDENRRIEIILLPDQ